MVELVCPLCHTGEVDMAFFNKKKNANVNMHNSVSTKSSLP